MIRLKNGMRNKGGNVMADKAVAKVCPFCKSTTWVSVPVKTYEAWQMGISGICPECQKETFEDEQG